MSKSLTKIAAQMIGLLEDTKVVGETPEIMDDLADLADNWIMLGGHYDAVKDFLKPSQEQVPQGC